ncbi:hypothetical protein AUEXF2481DRAFT_80025 [Aureobasidium subglaciale EXF-2481]|uniref:ABC transporter domain-containing protein n=1 Tax=Aureobasidium subglaciale (strain EXF-2481) TaxID=1043005 RepID=A0A074YB10_AURSE|nr:uncharacterized protein AUEXF2481DRAFT_80025 [Aureobasidium subglaciale EXF-2481]KEQ94965.1 hypothetical protein AUEXF2481DRAFT_80025 [Aureobasidium subglaciale EXF-2481]
MVQAHNSPGRGRGAYFKAKYAGRGGRGGGVTGAEHQPQSSVAQPSSSSPSPWTQLSQTLDSIDGQQYGSYKRLQNARFRHVSPDFTLAINHVQADAYASPSKISVRMDWKTTGFPDEYATSDIRQIALADYLSRAAAAFIRSKHMDQSVGSGKSGWSGPKGGAFNINSPAQEVLPRTSALIIPGGGNDIEMRFTVSLPARGRTILGGEAKTILCTNLPELIKQTMLYSAHVAKELEAHIHCVEDQAYMRSQLEAKGLVAFVGNGSILPRASGASARGMTGKHVVPFESPPELEVALKRKHGSKVHGTGVPKGITLLTGGGYHGKSTLLEALQFGIYNYVPGDGRELVVTNSSAMKVRAEDGRSVTGTNISAFIKNLPGKRDTEAFTTDDASGSTSMAANIQEALELGAQVIMVDEDTSATNLLVRDERMQMLVKNEPITPLVSKVRALYEKHGVSTIIVVGGLGDWLDVADNVVGMDSYTPRMLNSEAQELIEKMPRKVVQDKKYGTIPDRVVGFPAAILHDKTPYAKRRDFITIYADRALQDPSQDEVGIDISNVEQLVEMGQTRTIAHCIRALAQAEDDEGVHLKSALTVIEANIALEKAIPKDLPGGDFVAVRRFELGAAVNRIRELMSRAGGVEAQTGEGPKKKARMDN